MDLIVGMHRSGSSLLARILFKAGANFGDPAGFYPADRWNPDGYFEQIEVLKLNRLLLHGPWGKFTYLFLPSSETMRRRGRRIAPALRGAAQKYASCLVKDPRFNFTRPIWEEHGAGFGKVIVCLRDPFESAFSLKRRNRLPIPLGLVIWKRHYERLLANYGSREMWVFDYSRFVAAETSIEEAHGVIRFLGLPFRDGVDDVWIRESIHYRKEKINCRDVADYPDGIARIWSYFRGINEKQLSRAPMAR